jgi:hypothetical protein
MSPPEFDLSQGKEAHIVAAQHPGDNDFGH